MKKNWNKKYHVKRKVSTFICAIFGVMILGVNVYAGERVSTGTNAGYSLTCTSICKIGSGTAKTLGAAKPYNNYASVVIYGKDGASQGTTYGFGGIATGSAQTRTAAVATKYGSNLSKAVTYHAVVDSAGSFVDGFLNQLVYTVVR